jgi:GNAT superfamily N-acetyltransferase
MSSDNVTLRSAEARDTEAIVAMISELAEFERLSHLLQVTPQALGDELFGARPAIECVVAEASSGELAGFALFYTTFSTFLGRRGLWLEDLYVRPAWRGRGVGQDLLRHGARLAVQRGLGRYEWSVLDWNENAIRLYRGMGADVMPDWRICRVTGAALHALGAPGAS